MAIAGTERAVVVGAGIGGIVAALLLANRGLQVTLVEAGDEPGGKMRAVRVGGGEGGGVAIDGGPTVFTMRWVFDEILAEVGTSLDELVRLDPLDVLARHAWRDDPKRLDLYADPQRSADAIAAFSSPAEARRFVAFCDQARSVYRRLEGPHIRASRQPGAARTPCCVAGAWRQKRGAWRARIDARVSEATPMSSATAFEPST